MNDGRLVSLQVYENECRDGSVSVEGVFIYYLSSEEGLAALTCTRVAFYSSLPVILNIFLAGICCFLNDNNARNNDALLYGGHKHWHSCPLQSTYDNQTRSA